MEIINLTPHRIDLIRRDGSILRIEPAAPLACPRVAQKSEPVAEVDGVVLTRPTFGAVENLPAPREGVLLVVSGMVRAAVPERTDLASPGDPVRDAEGKIIGARTLQVN